MTTAAPPPATLDLATGPGDPEEGRGRRLAPWVAAGIAVAVTGLIAGGLAVEGRGPLAGGLGSGPAVLHIGATAGGGGAQGLVSDAKGLRSGRYVLTGPLPASPRSGTAIWLQGDGIDEDAVASLASSLGLSSAPTREGQDWVVRDGGAVLRVYGQPGLPFAFDASPDDSSCPSIPTDGYRGRDSAVGCAVSPPDPATTPVPGPDSSAMRQLAGSVAGALASAARISVWSGTPYGSATLDPTVDGLPTTGAGLTIQASTDGIVAASGWLAGFGGSDQTRGDSYPLTSARDTFGTLGAMPEPAIACAEGLDGSSMCGGDVILTGASYGLSLAFDDERPVLVPTWLFAVKGSDTPLSLIAVERRYLADPTGSGSGSGAGGGTSGSTGGSTGTAPDAGIPPTIGQDTPQAPASDLPLDVDPAVDPIRDPGTEVAVPRGPLAPGAAVTVIGPRVLRLTVFGGCELQTAVAAAKETATSVVLSYTFQPLPCPSALSGATTHRSLRVTLSGDLAGRTILDEAGHAIPMGDAIE